MADEFVTIPLRVPDGFFEELDRRFADSARRAADGFARAMKGGGGASGGGHPGGGAFGGSGTASGKEVGGAFGSIFSGAAAGVIGTPAASAYSAPVLGQNLALGAAQGGLNGLTSLSKFAGSAIGGAIGTGLGGPLGGVAGAALGGAAGESLTALVQTQFNSVKNAMEVPTERGVARLKGIYGNLAAAGVETNADERAQAISFTQAIERRRYEGERQVEKEYREYAARDSISYGLNFCGR